MLILRVVTYGYNNQEFNFLYEKLLRLYTNTPQAFVIKCFLIFTIYKVKNFAANNNHSSCWSQSRIGINAKSQSQIRNLCIKGKKATTRSCPIGYWSESSTIGWYFGISQGNGKIFYTCNSLIVNQWILGSGDLKFTRWKFFLARGFPHSSTNHQIIYFLLRISYLVCWCLHDLHVI